MKKITVETQAGVELEISPGSHVFFKEPDGRETYRDWQELRGKLDEVGDVYDQSIRMLERIKSIVPAK